MLLSSCAPRGIKILRKSRALFPCFIDRVTIFRDVETPSYRCAREQMCMLAPTEYRMPLGRIHVYLAQSSFLRAISGSRLLNDIQIRLALEQHIQRQRPDARRPRVAFVHKLV